MATFFFFFFIKTLYSPTETNAASDDENIKKTRFGGTNRSTVQQKLAQLQYRPQAAGYIIQDAKIERVCFLRARSIYI